MLNHCGVALRYPPARRFGTIHEQSGLSHYTLSNDKNVKYENCICDFSDVYYCNLIDIKITETTVSPVITLFSMTASLQHQLLPNHTAGMPSVFGFGAGFTRFLTCGDNCDEEISMGPQCQPLHESPTPRYEFDAFPGASAIAAAHQARQQLSEALATTLLMHGPITRKAPTLRLAVEALRTAQ